MSDLTDSCVNLSRFMAAN